MKQATTLLLIAVLLTGLTACKKDNNNNNNNNNTPPTPGGTISATYKGTATAFNTDVESHAQASMHQLGYELQGKTSSGLLLIITMPYFAGSDTTLSVSAGQATPRYLTMSIQDVQNGVPAYTMSDSQSGTTSGTITVHRAATSSSTYSHFTGTFSGTFTGVETAGGSAVTISVTNGTFDIIGSDN